MYKIRNGFSQYSVHSVMNHSRDIFTHWFDLLIILRNLIYINFYTRLNIYHSIHSRCVRMNILFTNPEDRQKWSKFYDRNAKNCQQFFSGDLTQRTIAMRLLISTVEDHQRSRISLLQFDFVYLPTEEMHISIEILFSPRISSPINMYARVTLLRNRD